MFEGETFKLKSVRLVLSNACGERGANLFSLEIFFSLFPFFEALSRKVGAEWRVGAYFIATIFKVISYSNFVHGVRKCKEILSPR